MAKIITRSGPGAPQKYAGGAIKRTFSLDPVAVKLLKKYNGNKSELVSQLLVEKLTCKKSK